MTRLGALGPAVLLLAGALCVAALPASYSCGSATGCASNSPPKGLAPAETPQIILISHDDAITVTSNNVVRGVVNEFKNPGGCNVPVTFFVSGGSGSNCNIVKSLQQDNHEIATHTLSHVSLMPSADIAGQISQQRAWLNQTCGIPLSSLVGFRAPYLLHNPQSRQALQELGFKYDASIIESWPSATSPSSASRLWPYSMAAGIPQDCQWMAPSTCNASERYNGLWEVPLQQFATGPVTNGRSVALSSMDPTADTEAALLAQLREQLSFSYNGNRAPWGIYLHTPWFAAKPFHATTLATFINETLAQHSDVYFLTFSQLIRWLEAPVKASQMRSWLTCNDVDFAAQVRAPCTTYTVQAGDTVFSISAQQEVELAALQAVNPSLASTGAIYVGQRLRLPPYDDTCPDTLAGQPPCRNYTVAPGDSLYSIAMNFTLTVNDLTSVNTGLTATSTLSIGQTLRIPPWPAVECFFGNHSVPASPEPASPAPASPAPADVVSCGSEVVELDMQLTGFHTASFDAHLVKFIAGMAALVRVQPACIQVTRTANIGTTATGQRRLLAQRSLLGDALLATVSIMSSNATRTAGYLSGAQQLGSLQGMTGLLGGQVDSMSYTALSDTGAVILLPSFTPLVPAPLPSPAPINSTTNTTSPPSASPVPISGAAATPVVTKKSSKVGAIVGGVLGGFFGALAIVGLAVLWLRRRRNAATGGSGGLRATWTNPAFAGAGATATLNTSGAAGAKQPVELAEVIEQTGTPSSARRRTVPSPFN